MSEIKNSFFETKYYWCKNCDETIKLLLYLFDGFYNSENISKLNQQEEARERKFKAEHNENCKKNKIIDNISEISNLIEQKLTEFRIKKAELERTFLERKDIVNLEKYFGHNFFWILINSVYSHFRKQLNSEIFPYTPNCIVFSGFKESDRNRGWVSWDIFRCRVNNNYLIKQVLSLSLNKKFKTESTDLTSQISEYNFLQLMKTLSHEISHCLLSDFYRIYGYNGEYSHRLEHERLIAIIEEYLWKTEEIKLIVPLIIDFIKEKIEYVKENIWHLEEEEKQLATEEIVSKKNKREKIKENLKYLAHLQIDLEKIKEK